jgi:hypothetical protein
MAMGSSQIMGM